MRVSTQQSYTSMTNSFDKLSAQLEQVVTQMATGKRVNLPSDDPIAATRITQLNRQQSSIEQYQSNIETVSSSMSQQESIMDGVNNDLLAIRDDLLQAANGTNTADDLSGYGQEIQSLTQTIVAALNYQDEDGHYIFGGTVNDQPPIVYQDTDGDGEPDEYVYQGNDEHRTATVSNGVEIDTNVSVGEMFGDSLNVLNSLNDLATELQDPSVDPTDPQVQADIQSAVDSVDEASDSLNSAMASLGERQNTMTMLSDAQTGVSTANDELIGQLGDLDYGPATITFTGLQLAMEATMKTYAKVSELNLFNAI
ncbi:flagellar hook-associated protein 3 [Leminorella grimontii]|uniref:Flagellar hook-associated protein 3 n=1 Tax=Leminorella grimontii TaxID=82981 RepID=A0AAV5N0U3_9GAMM|nr:flagellar hook-associated protein FlgL [Leminorella grimontii]KFC93565.1 FlgL family flagellar hook-associated protein [Leminorella grimontii ATCC 33999 = DSM 5078]GKX55740.1 flagellar hook-associated protein 3 [Leminorella grimontii]VFS55250.1 Hook-filament junction protein [Leminorella grimontii]